MLIMHHDEDAEVYLNGVPATKAVDFTRGYEEFDITPEAAATLRPGKNLIAIHCHQTKGGQYIDAGMADAKWSAPKSVGWNQCSAGPPLPTRERMAAETGGPASLRRACPTLQRFATETK